MSQPVEHNSGVFAGAVIFFWYSISGGSPLLLRCLALARARPTGLEFAILALEDIPVRTRVAEVAVPGDHGGV
jgi:hypothetical protein